MGPGRLEAIDFLGSPGGIALEPKFRVEFFNAYIL